MEQNPFPTRLVLRLASIPIALIIAAVVQGSRGCHLASSSAPTGPMATPDDISAARAKIEAADKARREAFAKAKDTTVPRTDLGVCPARYEPLAAMKSPSIMPSESRSGYDVAKWDPKAPNDFMTRFADELVAIERIGISYAEEREKPGPNWFRFESDVRSANVAKSTIDRATDFSRDPEDYQLIIDHEIEGKIGKEETFESGLLVGRFYVWDHQKGAITCAARVAATSSDKLNFRVEPGSSGAEKLARIIRSDLRAQALAQAKGRLFVAGPPLDTLDAGLHHAGEDGGRTDGGKLSPKAPKTSDAGGKP